MKPLIVYTLVLASSLYANEALRSKALQHGLKPMNSIIVGKQYKKEMIQLGKKLFFEKKLSLNRDISCASCHAVNKGGADGRSTAVGDKGQLNPSHLNTPTVLNTAFSKHFFWDGRSKSLQDQAKGPLQAPFEMASTPKLIEQRLKNDHQYKTFFTKAFGDSTISFERTAKAISAYENTLITTGRYDRFLEGDLNALNDDEKEGLNLFIDKGCIGCHNGVGLGGQEMRKFPLLHHPIWSMVDHKTINRIRTEYLDLLSDDTRPQKFQDDVDRYSYLIKTLGAKEVKLLSAGYFQSYTTQESYRVMTGKGCYTCHTGAGMSVDKQILKEKAFAFKNTGGFLGKDKSGRYFRAPLLRNVVRTAPYFHNGSVKTLEDAVKIMVTYQSRSKVSEKQIAQMVAFLKAVDSE